jgi:hypothetical protein
MQAKTIVSWLAILAVVFIAWKYLAPWVKEKTGDRPAAESTGDGGNAACVTAAERASERWGSGLGRFVNPPYDLEAWSGFTDGVNEAIASAEEACSCEEESCQTASGAMQSLRSLVSEMDTALRSGGSPPSDAVQQQEAIDNKINEARAALSE